MDASIERLIQELAAPLQELRDRARSSLVAAGRVALPALMEALRHPERAIRTGAALALGELRAPEAATALAKMATDDPDPSARPLALRALADLAHPGCPEVVPRTLLAKLSDPDLFARALACTGLGRIGDPPSRAALGLALQDREEWVRQAARQALAALPASPPRAGPGARTDSAGTALVARPGGAPTTAPSPVESLLAALASLDITTQRNAQEGLRVLGEPVVPRLLPLLRDPMPHVRRAAAELLGVVGGGGALLPLEDLLSEPEPSDELRAMVLHALTAVLRRCGGDTGSVRLLELLRHHLDRESIFVRAAAAAALITASPGERGSVLEHLHEDEEEEWARVAALRALRDVAGPADLPLVPQLLDELAQMTDPAGQEYLLDALARILADAPSEDSARVVGPATFFLESPHPAVRGLATRLLARTASPPNPKLLRIFIKLLDENPEDVELLTAVGRLARGGDAAAVPVLRRALGGQSEEAARIAARGLAGVGGRAALDALVEVANARAGRATALAAQALASLDPAGEMVATRRPDGRWERRLQLRCSADQELLGWVERDGREELRCPRCQREYALSPAEKLFAADRTPFGLCRCPGCRRRQLLVRRGETDALVCPHSGEIHIRPFDHPRQVHLLSELPLGACTCCAEPQPLVRVDEEVRCYRTRRPYRAGPRGFEEAPEAAAPAVAEDVAAINRALLLGTLGIAESGLAASEASAPEDPARRR